MLKFKRVKNFYMNYRKIDYLIGIVLSLFIITFSICFVVFFTPFYHYFIGVLRIDLYTPLTIEQIKINYQCMIDYFNLFNRGSLQFVDLTMSVQGRIHFEDVKKIFDLIQLVCITTGLSSIVLLYKQNKIQEYRYFKITYKLVLGIPLILLFICMIDFSRAFIVFHKLLFRNEYWVFDYVSDPVIRILPENFFMYAFVFMIIIVISLSLVCYKLYKNKMKQIIISSQDQFVV